MKSRQIWHKKDKPNPNYMAAANDENCSFSSNGFNNSGAVRLLDLAFVFFLSLTLETPLDSSIILIISAWSLVSIGATEMSLTALNLPQLLMCSFSNRKKFQTNRRKTSKMAKTVVNHSA